MNTIEHESEQYTNSSDKTVSFLESRAFTRGAYYVLNIFKNIINRHRNSESGQLSDDCEDAIMKLEGTE